MRALSSSSEGHLGLKSLQEVQNMSVSQVLILTIR